MGDREVQRRRPVIAIIPAETQKRSYSKFQAVVSQPKIISIINSELKNIERLTDDSSVLRADKKAVKGEVEFGVVDFVVADSFGQDIKLHGQYGRWIRSNKREYFIVYGKVFGQRIYVVQAEHGGVAEIRGLRA